LLGEVLDGIDSPTSKKEIEISIEANPGDADEGWFNDLVDAGVNRFSIGVQALDDKRLRWLGRRHTRRQAEQAVHAALRAGAGSVGADLIYGTPGQSAGGLKSEVSAFAGLGVQHISAYELTAHPSTVLGQKIEAGAAVLPDSDMMADLWQAVSETLSGKGFLRYEISNYARHGHNCRHNEHYWRGGMYLGLGAGAWGFVVEPSGEMVRYSNTADVGEYIRAAEDAVQSPLLRGLGAGCFHESISQRTHAQELVMLGLRTSQGVSLEQVLWNLRPEDADRWNCIVDGLVSKGTATLRDQRLFLTEETLLLADTVAQLFFEQSG
jgi:oxygen-independent coproporphyrinogen-3 oxidase